MVELNIVNFVTVGVIALLFAWIYNTYIKPMLTKTVAAVSA